MWMRNLRFIPVVFLSLAMGLSVPADASPVFDTFGALPEATFGGSGIPNDAVAISTVNVGNVEIKLGLTATQRFFNPPPGNDGAGTFFVPTGANFGGPGDPSGTLGAKWNFGYFVGLTGGTFGDIADLAVIRLLYDTSPDGSDFGIWDLSASIAALSLSGDSVFEDSQNLLFSFLNAGVPGFIQAPTSPFDASAAGTYSFVLEVDDSNGNRLGLSAIDVRAVPEPPSVLLFVLALLGLAGLRGWSRARRCRTV